MTRMTNKLKHRAILLVRTETVDESDRPKVAWVVKRVLNFQELGITATEKYQSLQAKTDVVKRIRIRYDPTITQLKNRVEIDKQPYLITRLYVDPEHEYMEMSLNYVN